MTDQHRDWNQRYVQRDTPWDTGRPSRQLERVLDERQIEPCRALEIGCGTGTNAVFLAQRGFQVTAFDVSPLAIEQARERAREAGASVDFYQADMFHLPDWKERFQFVFDRGVYHVLRRENVEAFSDALVGLVDDGGLYLVLAGNANEVDPPEGGPPRVTASELCGELEPAFELIALREFRFEAIIDGEPISPLAWSALWRRKRG
jgi:SAM-dependent methyltransferase